MNLRRFVYPCAILLIGVAVLSTFKFYFKEIPFYKRLKSRKKRPQYQLHNLQIDQSCIFGNLTNQEQHLTFKLCFLNSKIIQVQINDSSYKRYVIPDVVALNPPIADNEEISLEKLNDNVHIKYMSFKVTINTTDFLMKVYKNSTEILSINSQQNFCIEDKEPNVGVAADFVFADALRAYGLPQHADQMSLALTKDKPYRLFNVDRFAYSTKNQFESLYGSVPLLYGHGKRQTTGLLWLNSSETYVDIEYGNGTVTSTFFSESGAVNFYVLSGPSLGDCVEQYAQLTGAVPLPPLFALGYHQCRFSYMSQEEVEEVSNKFDENELPLDSIWLDIDYTDDKKYFTWNPKTYQNPDKLLEYLKAKKRKAVAIIDPHIKVNEDYFVYTHCEREGFFVKNANKTSFRAKCWPGTSSWIDFFNPKARHFYADLHEEFAKARNLYIWNDMNEPALFETKENSMPKNLLHYGNWKHRDVHNLYGFYQTMATYEGLLKRDNLRPFILTRSHFAGSQRFAAIWTGDNIAEWAHLKISVPMCLTASLAGFSLCGADIGGFVKHPSDELLQRWYQLGAWLPFFRGHSNRNVPRREPYLYDKETQNIIRNSLQQRYQHLLHWYTLFWQHSTTFEPVIRPLIYQYPQDQNALDLDHEFLIGKDILVCPVTDAQVGQIDVYLPGGETELWYCEQSEVCKYYGTGHIKMPVDMNHIPVFYRGGSIIPVALNPVQSSAFLQDSPIALHIFCDTNGLATGTLYSDDTESFDYLQKCYNYVRFNLEHLKISNFQINVSSKFKRSIILSSINLYGFELDVNSAQLETENAAADHKLNIVRENDFIQICNIKIDVFQEFVITLSD